MSRVGAQLKQAREAQRKTRVQVAEKTGILIHDLAALEHGHFDALPDDQTAAAFVRTYAEHLGFRPEEPVAEFWSERGIDPPSAQETAAEDEPTPANETRRFPWGWTLAATAALVLAFVWLATRGGPADEPPVVAPNPAPVERAAAAAVEPVPAEPVSLEPAAVPPAPATAIQVTEYGVGRDVRDRELVGEADRFRTGRDVWFWTRVEGGQKGDRVSHVWIHAGREIATVELEVGSANWRTWSTKSMNDGSPGEWVVEARDPAGRMLARSEFVCR